MPFTRTQSILKRLLPERWFRLLYNLAVRSYLIWLRISEGIYHFLAYIYYTLIGDSERAKGVKAVNSIRRYSMVGRSGLLFVYDATTEMERNKIDGCFVECGVARGGCSALMAIVAFKHGHNRKVWLFDSFEGLPEQTSEDEGPNPLMYQPKNRPANYLAPGYCLGTYEEVEELLFSKLDLDRNNIYMVKGWFQDTLPEYREKVGAIAVLRLDGDWYESTKCCLENLYDNVITGGYIIIDDYFTVPGCKKATDEFLKNRNINVNIICNNMGWSYFVKP